MWEFNFKYFDLYGSFRDVSLSQDGDALALIESLVNSKIQFTMTSIKIDDPEEEHE